MREHSFLEIKFMYCQNTDIKNNTHSSDKLLRCNDRTLLRNHVVNSSYF